VDPRDPDTAAAPHRLNITGLSGPDCGLDGAGSSDWSDPPLTSEPPLPDTAPLTSEPPLTTELPLISEPTAPRTGAGTDTESVEV
jgi:hypothetical protein